MKQLAMTVVFTLVFGLAALAQTPTPSDPQSGTMGSQPAASPSQTASPESASSSAKAEKLKGCIESENGKYTLRQKDGKSVALASSEDLSAQVGHTVTVHGSYEAASASNLPAGTGTPSASTSDQQFNVTKIDKVSDTCEMPKSK